MSRNMEGSKRKREIKYEGGGRSFVMVGGVPGSNGCLIDHSSNKLSAELVKREETKLVDQVFVGTMLSTSLNLSGKFEQTLMQDC